MQTETIGGNKYFVFFVDDYYRMSWVFFVRHKSEAFGCFKKFIAMVERQFGCKLKALRTDRGGEFMSKEFAGLREELGVKREHKTPYTLQQNGVAERKNYHC